MTGTNIFSLNAEVGNAGSIGTTGSRNKAATEEAASVFASMMNQTASAVQAPETVNSDSVAEVNKTEAADASNEAYDR